MGARQVTRVAPSRLGALDLKTEKSRLLSPSFYLRPSTRPYVLHPVSYPYPLKALRTY